MAYAARHRKFPPNSMTQVSSLHGRQYYCPVHDLNRSIVSDFYKSDEFRMYKHKVLLCEKRFSHDWTSCPFTHVGEKARRRNPRSYLPILCPFFKDNSICRRGDSCKFSHGTFEYFLHPGKYRTAACENGPGCKRPVCFFAHSVEELRDEMTLTTEEIHAAFSYDAHLPVAIAPRQVLRALAARSKLTSARNKNNAAALAALKGKGKVTDDSFVADKSTFWNLENSPASLWSVALNAWPHDFNGLVDLLKEIKDANKPEGAQTCRKSSLDANARAWTRDYSLF
ncbi:hypothetical protein AG4045_013030 [Apium graveolens]|uniref:C3H1-type domain-containing protein n=1 Tax=Apium graveolens TaxID=4045 RepID=A0A6L5B9P5_APIGR|nr:hypothetical protein AG4045_013030 [Apium graveolens]